MVMRILVCCVFLLAGVAGTGCVIDGTSAQSGASLGGDEPECEDDCPENSTGAGGGPAGEAKYWVTAGERVAEARRKPWSSWWYPLWQDTLFNGENGELSTLEKYDAWAAKYGNTRSSAADYERTTIYDPRAASWAGLCDAWAIASILQPEPTSLILHGNLTFDIGDQKALLIKTYEKVPALPLVGTRFDGEWDDVYEDILPHDMHRVIEDELISKKRAFIIDEDAGPEVWNQPAWKVITRIERDAADANVAHVRTWLFLASPHVDDRDYIGTVEDSREYTYDLEGTWQDDKFGVKSGRWTDRSQWDHPDYAIVVPEKVARGSFNTQIHPATVDRILGR